MDNEHTSSSINYDSDSKLNSISNPNENSDNEIGQKNQTKKNQKGYSWQVKYKTSWNEVSDNKKNSEYSVNGIEKFIENRRKKILKNSSVSHRRDIIRVVILILDGSLVMSKKSLRPNNFLLTLSLIQEFIVKFFDLNPISQLGIIILRNGVAKIVSEVNGLSAYHIEKIKQIRLNQYGSFEPKGDPSLQNGLEMARSMLLFTNGSIQNLNKNSKEVLIIFGAIFTVDPGDIYKTIDSLVKDKIKTRIIGLSAQIHICEEIVKKTNNHGSDSSHEFYKIILNESHFKEVLMESVAPFFIAENESNNLLNKVPLMKMGFPMKIKKKLSHFILNSEYTIKFPKVISSKFFQNSDTFNKNVDVNDIEIKKFCNIVDQEYQCPQCKMVVSTLPIICPICGLMLTLSIYLAKSYHYLFPSPYFEKITSDDPISNSYCYGCLTSFPKNINTNNDDNKLNTLFFPKYNCTKCKSTYCDDCDIFIHAVLHNCPTCENIL